MTRTLSALALALATLLAASAAAADVKYALTGENTKITFVGTKPGGKHDGGFKTVTGNAVVTDGKLETLKIDVTIDTDSLYSDNEKLTGHLKNPDFFDVKTYKTAKFVSTKVEKNWTGYTITGDLTMLDKTKSVSFPATVTEANGALTINADFSIDRNDWGMSYGKGKIDDKVSIKVAVNTKR